MAQSHKAHARARRSAAARSSQTERSSHNRHACRLHCEHLEDRRLLAVVIVDTVDDAIDFTDGKTSLREAIFATNTVPGADEIQFDPALFSNASRTILLTQGELSITDSLTITGPGAELLKIDASGSDPTPQEDNNDGSRLFLVPGNASVNTSLAISSLTLAGGDRALDQGGAIYAPSPAHLVQLVDCVLVDNAAFYGGAVFANWLEIESSWFEGNRANSGGAIIGGDMRIVDSGFARNASKYDGGAISYGGAADIVGTEFFENFAGDRGGAISAFGILNIERSVLRDNEAVVQGGAIYYGGGPLLSVTATRIENNLASQLPNHIQGGNGKSGGAGGGIFAGWHGRIEIVDSQITNNRAKGAGGGANLRGEVIVIDRSTVVGNDSAEEGGGLRIDAGRAEIRHSTIADNKSQERGGGLYARSNSEEVIIVESEIRDNKAIEQGGGIYANGGRIVIERSTLSGNSAWGGGGLNITFSGHAIVRQSTVSGNHASYGGGIKTEVFSRVDLIHSTVAANTASIGGGGLVYGRSTTLNHSILAGNASPGEPDLLDNGYFQAAVAARWSVIGDRGGVALVEAPVGSPDANGNLIGGPIHGAIDLKLGPLADNGGSTLTHALLPGSPAIGDGDHSLVPGVGDVPEFDQRGAPFTRVAGARIDIGAFEVQSPSGALNADFDFDGFVDGADFLVWQRNLGKASSATLRHGDATADGDVDGNDLAVWRAKFGAESQGAISKQLSAVSGVAQGSAAAAPMANAELVGVAQRHEVISQQPAGRTLARMRGASLKARRESFASLQQLESVFAWWPSAREAALERAITPNDACAEPKSELPEFAAAIDELEYAAAFTTDSAQGSP